MVWYQKRQNKYNATSTEYGGLVYHSKKEAAYAQELDLRVKAKDIKSWDRQVKFDFNLIREGDKILLSGESRAGKDSMHLETYYLDFVIHHNDETKEYVEVKGFVTTTWRHKWRLMEFLYGDDPEIIMTVVT